MADLTLEARSPNLSPGRVAYLLGRFPDIVMANSVFPMILWENPDCLNGARIEPLLKLLVRTELPECLINALTRHPQREISEAAQMHVVLGVEVTDWKPVLRNLGALRCSGEDYAILEKLELIPEWLRPHVIPPATENLKRSVSVWQRVDTPLSWQQAVDIQNLSERERVGLAYCTHSSAILELLSQDSSQTVVRSVARNLSASLEFLTDLARRMAAGSYREILAEIAQNPNCTPELAKYLRSQGVSEEHLARFLTVRELGGLFLEGEHWAAIEARRRDDAPLWLIAEGLVLEGQRQHAYLTWFCGLLATQDPRHLTRKTRSTDWFTRFATAIHPSTMPKTLEKLVTDANRYVRFVAKARLSDTTWEFPPATCGGQGDSI